jgi:hypothetical protein
MDTMDIIFAVLMGFSLAATCGLRAFLPLLIISIAARSGYLTLSPGFIWMMSWPAIICFATATVLEILGDKVPAVDHVLDSAGVFVRPVAGAVAASSMITGIDPLLALVIGIIMGATVAGLVQTIKGAIRLLSSTLTGGIANPVVSIVEDSATALTGVISLIAPYITASLILVGIIMGMRVVSRRLRKKAPQPEEINDARS